MAFSDELFFAPAHKLAAMLRKREVSSVEMVDAFIERIETVNRGLNAVVTLVEERASREAEESDRRLSGKGEIRPLEGIPVTIKDSIITEGVRSTWGMKMFEHHVARQDAPTVERLRAAGAIVIAKTNTPEMTMDYDCDNPVFGPTNNPWNRERVPGGSSGGEAAALAVGMSPLGMGSDFRGSIRVPAAFCGVVGLKPSWGTIPGSGHMAPGIASPPPIAHMATIGPMARYVDDLTLAYNVVKGPHPSAPYTVPTAQAHPEKVDLKTVRCAIFTDACEVPVASEIRAAIERAGRELQKMGIVVEAVKPPIDDGDRLWWEYNGADGNQLMAEAFGEGMKHSRERLRKFLVAGESKSAAEFFKIAIQRDGWRVQLAEFMERYPIILGPAFCVTAFKHGATEVEIDGKTYPHFMAGWPVAWGNCAGLPGVVVPCGKDRDGLPIGLQINGRAFGEETVLAVAKAAETALGGYQKPPL
ncbi:amidase [Candidatus Binatus sp.]|uniref:amidase n=1 Tax=Candidatus Binatus sp. TaxID=2811406 RepID=UPI003C31DDE3